MKAIIAPLVAVTAALLLVGCSATASAPESPAGAISPAIDAVPEACRDAYPYAVEPADIASVNVPDGWPDDPPNAALCLATGGGGVESLSYATETPFAEVVAYYEQKLAGYEIARVSGAENGTGYDSLDGAAAGLSFQVQERETGFVIAFVREGEAQ